MATTVSRVRSETLRTLPDDNVRQILWRFADRYDLQMLVQSAREVARGPVARLVAQGLRGTHEWTAEKATLLEAFDQSGITAVFMDPEQGGYLAGPKNLALALTAFELAWVDAGAATCSLAGCLALAPIHERGTAEQQAHYMSLAVPPAPGEDRQPLRGAFCLTEPIPYVGVDTGILNGKLRVEKWADGDEPLLRVEKRGRFITNMGFANFVTAAVDSGDDRIKGSCIIILEESDPGLFDRGTPTRKLVHQLSSTCDPIFNVTVPASRIVGGYTVKDGTILPNYSHSEVIEAVFKRTRVTVALMTSAKLLSAIEPIIRYQRGRFRGSEQAKAGMLRYELGLQQRQDALHRLASLWAIGEAGASLGFAAARLCDELDALEPEKNEILATKGVSRGRSELKFFRDVNKSALEFLRQENNPPAKRSRAYEDLKADPLVQFALKDAISNVFCPAAKLWNTGTGSNAMREALSLMGGYGITEDCPGFLTYKWMDTQLEATYEGPEAVQRRNLSVTMTNELFLAQFRNWILEMRRVAEHRPGTGACSLATAMQLWLWTFNHLQVATDADGGALYQSARQGVTFPLADALCWLLAARQQTLDLIELETHGPANPVLAEGLEGTLSFFTDLCHIQAARSAGEVGRICAELVFGYNRHPAWDEEGYKGCYRSDELDSLEGLIPGIVAMATDVIGTDGSHPIKAGPCASCNGLEGFQRLRSKLDGCLTGAQLSKDRAAEAISKVMIPEALDYPR
ncbi:MAG: acyl-CoA dehydrogenase family protein [Candidatus Korobacteraceae bacterium]|jgi:alkylation response protein AidB-like acyl-CoA dehydrogenase